ncbi:MAG: dienelactone hydrolase family protein [Candidatus Dependentiae bacterium]
MIKKEVDLSLGYVDLKGDLAIPDDATALVIFAHGSGSSRHSVRNRSVAHYLQANGLATLLVDLLTKDEEKIDNVTQEIRFDIPLLAGRLIAIVDWAKSNDETKNLKIGFFGASTGSAAALIAAAEVSSHVHAVVSRGGRPDLAETALPYVQAPTLFIVGGNDTEVLSFNEFALDKIPAVHKELKIVLDATHLFEEPGAMEQVADLAMHWFKTYL